MTSMQDVLGRGMTRRQVLGALGMIGAGALTAPLAGWASGAGAARVMARAASTPAAGSDLGAIDHIVFLMMENRSYDHFFGAYPRGRGFDDHPRHALGAFAQRYPGGGDLVPKDLLLPFHLQAGRGEECTDDLTHDWGPQHLCWNHGRMDSFVEVHTSSTYEGAHGTMTMGYYERADLPFYWGLADAFTLCDGYHSSILGPTHPNRLMANSGTIDPAGGHGGPVTDTNTSPDFLWSCSWPTIQEVLEDRGVSWKVYHPSNVGVAARYRQTEKYPTWDPALYDPTLNPEVMVATDHVLPYFTAFRNPLSSLYAKAFNPTFPNDFVADVRSHQLPSVSWVIPPLGFDDHPSAAPDNGMWFTSLVLDALTADEHVWSRTALFVMYDENDGWFDHVPPPVPPPGTSGEYLTAAPPSDGDPDPQTLGIAGPLGLGVRVPMLVVSPFSRGGHIASGTFDHTSQLQLVEQRFGVEVPNVSAWRRRAVGDLTSTLFRTSRDTGTPELPATAPVPPTVTGACAMEDEETEQGGAAPDVPTKQRMPRQGGGSEPASRYYQTTTAEESVPDLHRTVLASDGPRPATTKSAYNRLAVRAPSA